MPANVSDRTDLPPPVFRPMGLGRALGLILLSSAGLFGFLVWLIYLKDSSGVTPHWIGLLPAVNASLNALSTVFLVAGFLQIKKRNFVKHMRFMSAAFISSALFLVCYIIYHNAHGDTRFTATGLVRPVYFFILVSHIVLSAVAMPLILTSFFLALSGRYEIHRRVSRFTFPIWLYVSVTGVVVFVMLKVFNA